MQITPQQADANFIAGKTYSYSNYISASMPVLESFYKNNPNAELAIGIQALEPDKEAGTTPAFRSNNPFGMMIGFSAQATNDQILAAWMYMEWMTQEQNLFTLQWGVEGQNYNMVNGEPVCVPYDDQPVEYKQGFNNKDYYCVTVESRDLGTAEDLIKASSPQGLPKDFSQDIIKNYYNQVEAWKKGWVPSDAMFAVSIESVNEYQGTLLGKYVELRDKLVTCKPEEFDKLYEQYTKEYNEAGYKEITDERRAAYKDGNCSKLK